VLELEQPPTEVISCPDKVELVFPDALLDFEVELPVVVFKGSTAGADRFLRRWFWIRVNMVVSGCFFHLMTSRITFLNTGIQAATIEYPASQ
jgi:hypothetical protein